MSSTPISKGTHQRCQGALQKKQRVHQARIEYLKARMIWLPSPALNRKSLYDDEVLYWCNVKVRGKKKFPGINIFCGITLT